MECIIGIKTNDFCIVAADTRSSRSIMTMKHDQEKTFTLSEGLLAGVCGEQGYGLSPWGAANFTRTTLANALRSKHPYSVNMILAGYDQKNGPELYYLDYLATLAKVPFAVHGYGGYMSLSVLDRNYRPDMTVEQATCLIRMCAQEIQRRFIVNLDRYSMRVVSKEGISVLPDMTGLSISP